ncbi:MAG: CHAP domain-containing protein [Sulfitobacter sp.]
MSVKRKIRLLAGITLMCAALSACATSAPELPKLSDVDIDPNRQALAIREVQNLRSQGKRAWCVPFARNLSGIEIRGNANTWWGQAEGKYARGNDPRIGAVMTFSKTRRLTMGHVAVVSEVISDREIRVDHANWHRNKISSKMAVIDVSEAGDWSAVKLESSPGTFGRAYPVKGFIYPTTATAI